MPTASARELMGDLRRIDGVGVLAKFTTGNRSRVHGDSAGLVLERPAILPASANVSGAPQRTHVYSGEPRGWVDGAANHRRSEKNILRAASRWPSLGGLSYQTRATRSDITRCAFRVQHRYNL